MRNPGRILQLIVPLATLASLLLSSCAPAPAAPAPSSAQPTAAATQAQAAEATSAPAPEPTQATEPTQAVEATEAPQPAKELAVPTTYQEAPMLDERVKAGTLPSVAERLPKMPFVVGPGVLITENDLPNWTSGRYGGTVRAAHAVADWAPDIFMASIENFLMAPGIGLDGIKPNILEDYQVEDDNKVFTFRLREGLKWSDGQPVTTEDIRFTYEDFMLNEKLTPIFPQKFRAAGNADGEPMKLEILDDYTFRITFTESYGGFLRELAIKSWQAYTDLMKPKHYLMQFHPKYTSTEKLQPLLDERKLKDEWWTLLNEKDCINWELTNPQCVGFPTLYPWVSVEGSQGVLAFERNPYYFKVDIDGKQLPYIDKILSQQSEDVEAVNLRVIAGEVDLLRESTALVKLPLYKENEARAGIRVQLMDMHVDPTALFFNLTYSDTVWNTVVNDVRFRKAVNLAINRPEIITSVYYDLASLPETVTGEYNPDEANRLLDEMGMDKRGADGFRLGPDGKAFVLPIEHGAEAPDIAPTAELVAEHLKNVGLNTSVKKIDTQLITQRANANDLFATVFWDVQPMWRDDTWNDYLPTNRWARAWESWYRTKGKEGQEPPESVKKLFEVYEGRVKSIPASEEDKKLAEELYRLYNDNVFFVPLVEKVKYALITSTKLANTPETGQAIAANASLEQMYFTE